MITRKEKNKAFKPADSLCCDFGFLACACTTLRQQPDVKNAAELSEI